MLMYTLKRKCLKTKVLRLIFIKREKRKSLSDYYLKCLEKLFFFLIASHKCSKVDQVFRHYFHKCELFILNIPQHGLYNFACTENRDNDLLSVIIENGIDVR